MGVKIIEYSTVLGKNHRTVEEIALHKDDETKRNMRSIGLERVPTENKKLLTDMIVEAYSKISLSPELIIISHSLPFLWKNREDISEKMNSIETVIMSGMPCAIMHEAVYLAKCYIEEGRYNRILVIGADKAYSDQERTFFNTIMGDCVVALLLDSVGKENEIIGSYIQTSIIAPNGELSQKEQINEFRSLNASFVRQAIERGTQKANLTLDDIDYFVPHTSNRMFWDGLASLMHLERSRFLDDNILKTGHFNSHDSFYHYITLKQEKKITRGQIALLVNPGFGGTQGCTIIKC